MAIGSDGTGWIEFNDYELARTIGVIALALILFEGGLTSGYLEIRPVLRPALSLALAGDDRYGRHHRAGRQLAARLLVAGGAAARLDPRRHRRSGDLRPSARLDPEAQARPHAGGGVRVQRPGGDPAGARVHRLDPASPATGSPTWPGCSPASSASAWSWAGRGGRRRLDLPAPEPGDRRPLSGGLDRHRGLAYGGAAIIDGSGFLAVYLAGLALGGAQIPAKRTVTAFHEGLAWVAQITLFLTLGLLVFPSQLGDVLVDGTLIALVVAFVARPLATAFATAFDRYSARERLVLGWAGLRGAVPVVLATFPVISGVSNSLEYFNIVFFAVVISTIVQGTTFEPLAKALGVRPRDRRCRGLWPRRERSADWAPRWSSTWSATATRSPGAGSESWDFRARRWSA